MGFEWVEKRGCGRGGKDASGVLLTKHRKGPAKQRKYALSIRLGADVMKQCRFVAGDYVMVGVDTAERMIMLKRTPDHTKGLKLVPCTSQKGSVLSLSGQCVSCHTKIERDYVVDMVFPNGVTSAVCEYVSTEEGLLIECGKRSDPE